MSDQAEKYCLSMSGEFFVAAQLQRLQVVASVTYGNAKSADVVAFSGTSDKAVIVEVKSSKKGRWPVGNRTPAPAEKPWVFVHFPKNDNEAPEFFILSQTEINKIHAPIEAAYLKKYKEKHDKEYGNKPGVAAINKKQIEQFKNNWKTILDLL